MEEKHFKCSEKKDVTSQQVTYLQITEEWAVSWGRITTCFPSTSCQPLSGKTNELDGPLAWFNTSVLTVFYYPFGMGGLLV